MNETPPLVRLAQWARAGLLRDLRPTELKVWVLLSAYASRDGVAFPSAETLARLAGTTRGRVFAALRRLCERGVLERGHRIASRYHRTPGPVAYMLQPAPDTRGILKDDVSDSDTSYHENGRRGTALRPEEVAEKVEEVPDSGTQIGVLDLAVSKERDRRGADGKGPKAAGNDGDNGNGLHKISDPLAVAIERARQKVLQRARERRQSQEGSA